VALKLLHSPEAPPCFNLTCPARRASPPSAPWAAVWLPRPAAAAFSPYTRRLDLEADTPFLRQKGIRCATAHTFEAGLWRGPGFLANCVGVRLHDTQGRPLGYAGRRLDPDKARRFGKWKLPPRLPKRDLLYNAHRALPQALRRLAVVECPWGAMRLAQVGLPAVALLGTQLFEAQRSLLRDAARIVLLLDGDPAGRHAAIRCADLLSPTVDVHMVDLPDGADPDDLSDAELVCRLRPFFPS